MKKNIKNIKKIGKKASSLQDLLFAILFIILVVLSIRSGIKVANASGFFIGEHQKEVFNMISEGDRTLYYFDELSRQALLYSLNLISKESTSGDCGMYAGYFLLNDGKTTCTVNLEEKFKSETKQYFDSQAKPSGISFETSFAKAKSTDSIIFSGRAPEKEFKSLKGSYTIKPSFETYLDYPISDFEKIDSTIARMQLCKNQDCLNSVMDEESTQNLKFALGTCEEKIAFSNLAEEISDCVASKDDLCTCTVAKSTVQTYSAELSNQGEDLLIKISGADSNDIILNGIKFDSQTKIDFDGMEKYILKSNGIFSLTSTPKNQCTIDKTKYRFCAKTDKQFYFYDETSKKVEKKNLNYKFAILINEEKPAVPASQDLLAPQEQAPDSAQ